MVKVNLEKIKQLRKDHKLSQEEMANIIGCKNMYPYHRKETGQQSFRAEELHAIAEYFNKELEYFFVNDVAKNAKELTSA